MTLRGEPQRTLHAVEHLLRVVRDALASLQGEIVDMKEVGSHSVMFVKTTHICVRADGDGLIYFDRNFHRIKRAASL